MPVSLNGVCLHVCICVCVTCVLLHVSMHVCLHVYVCVLTRVCVSQSAVIWKVAFIFMLV